MNSDHWESVYRRSIRDIQSPALLDRKILDSAKAIKPLRPARPKRNRLLLGVAPGFGAIAIAIALLQPAQYIGAAPGLADPQGSDAEGGLDRYRPKASPAEIRTDRWHSLRTEVDAGNYMALCAHWRRTQRSSGGKTLPADLMSKARRHCRILP